MTTEENKLEDKVKEIVSKVLPIYLSSHAFIDRKITDTPTDNLQVVPRKYVNMYGSVSGRPQNSVIGQQYFATDLGYPIFRNTNNAWVSPTGSVVG